MQRKINTLSPTLVLDWAAMEEKSPAVSGISFRARIVKTMAALSSRWENLSSAAAFAEAGEFDTARQILNTGKNRPF